MSSPRIQVFINGTPGPIAEVDGYGVISAILSWVKRFPDAQGPAGFDGQFWEEELKIDLGRMISDGTGNDHFNLLSQNVHIGDEVSFKVLSPNPKIEQKG